MHISRYLEKGQDYWLCEVAKTSNSKLYSLFCHSDVEKNIRNLMPTDFVKKYFAELNLKLGELPTAETQGSL